MKNLSFIIIVITLFPLNSFSKDCNNQKNQIALTLAYGIGHLSIVDEYISNERYRGLLSNFDIQLQMEGTYNLNMPYKY